MRFSTVLMFVLAFVCAGVAALLVRGSIMAGNGTNTTPQQSSAPELKPLLVAARDIKPGEKLTPDMVREVRMQQDLFPRGAFTSKEALFRGKEERIVSVAITANEPIVPQRLTGNNDNGLAARLNEGMRAITIKVNDASGVGGFIQAEDRVDVLLTQMERSSDTSSQSQAYTKTLLLNVRVLAVDQMTERKQQAQPPKTVTLEVKEDDAKKLTLAGNIGLLSLALSKGDKQQTMSGSVELRDILDKKADISEPFGTDVPVVTVIRSVEKHDYKVPRE